jgi:hypothetical protein
MKPSSSVSFDVEMKPAHTEEECQPVVRDVHQQRKALNNHWWQEDANQSRNPCASWPVRRSLWCRIQYTCFQLRMREREREREMSVPSRGWLAKKRHLLSLRKHTHSLSLMYTGPTESARTVCKRFCTTRHLREKQQSTIQFSVFAAFQCHLFEAVDHPRAGNDVAVRDVSPVHNLVHATAVLIRCRVADIRKLAILLQTDIHTFICMHTHIHNERTQHNTRVEVNSK